jgi:hypothetical protein
VEAPIGDFFACGWGEYAQVSSLAVCVNPSSAFNCYWPMPFRKGCRITLENLSAEELTFFYQIDYCLTDIPEGAAYFHARFRRENPLAYGTAYTIIDNIKGKGQYVGTYMAWGVNNKGLWGEGEIKFFIDDDKEYPTICETGTEDYFCGSYCFENPSDRGHYAAYTTPYTGFCQIVETDQFYRSQLRFGMYRWHITDPVRFDKELRVTMQALGWRSGGRYLPLQDDIASVAYWYQTLPTEKFLEFYSRDYLEII